MRPGQEFRYQRKDPDSGVMTDQVFPDLPEPYRRFSPAKPQRISELKSGFKFMTTLRQTAKFIFVSLTPMTPAPQIHLRKMSLTQTTVMLWAISILAVEITEVMRGSAALKGHL